MTIIMILAMIMISVTVPIIIANTIRIAIFLVSSFHLANVYTSNKKRERSLMNLPVFMHQYLNNV